MQVEASVADVAPGRESDTTQEESSEGEHSALISCSEDFVNSQRKRCRHEEESYAANECDGTNPDRGFGFILKSLHAVVSQSG